jgi:hypothetical protein
MPPRRNPEYIAEPASGQAPVAASATARPNAGPSTANTPASSIQSTASAGLLNQPASSIGSLLPTESVSQRVPASQPDGAIGSHEEELRAIQLRSARRAEERDRRAEEREEELHQARLEAIRVEKPQETSRARNRDRDEEDDDTGESVPEDLIDKIDRYIPGMPQSEIRRIYQGKFSFEGLARLRDHPGERLDDGRNMEFANGRFKLVTKGNRKDIISFLIWLEGFLNYCTIVDIVRKPSVELVVARRLLERRILHLSQLYRWPIVLQFAIQLGDRAMRKSQVEAASWLLTKLSSMHFAI